jgi:homoserine acetyltransferase
MVDAHYRLVKQGQGVKHLRLVIGNSMGGMHAHLAHHRQRGVLSHRINLAIACIAHYLSVHPQSGSG